MLKKIFIDVFVVVIVVSVSTFMQFFDYTLQNDQWRIKVFSTFKNYEIKFVLDKEFQSKTIDGRPYKFLFHLDENGKLIEKETKIRVKKQLNFENSSSFLFLLFICYNVGKKIFFDVNSL